MLRMRTTPEFLKISEHDLKAVHSQFVHSLAYKRDNTVTIIFSLIYKEYIRDPRCYRANQVVRRKWQLLSFSDALTHCRTAGYVITHLSRNFGNVISPYMEIYFSMTTTKSQCIRKRHDYSLVIVTISNHVFSLRLKRHAQGKFTNYAKNFQMI
ncbi:hypothetical protein FF38_06566 [Lucilia cuprina]|uniref:Uncharacterized protein n=1 Tax=Lucilia cuprina TaxID=7375 RepID=A0A0L0CB10_LUCCU|nr:hypothetical protein FF38_06566 [Lucilia cuprina]